MYGKEFYYYQELAGAEISFPFKSIEHHLVSSLGTTDDEVTDRKLILFAVNKFGFYIGTKGNDADKILTKTNMSEGFKVVADNVFEFLRGVTNSLSDVADAEQEYRKYMYALGYDGEDMEQEIADWRLYKRGFKH